MIPRRSCAHSVGVESMTVPVTIEEVLEKAIQKEIEAQQIYIKLQEMVKAASAKDAFHKLSRQEKGHQVRLEAYLRGDLREGRLSTGHVVDYKILELLGEPEVSGDIGLKDAFHLAASREKASHELYVSLAQIHPEGEVREMLEDLARQELAHKQLVESLYTEVAFPQTDGG